MSESPEASSGGAAARRGGWRGHALKLVLGLSLAGAFLYFFLRGSDLGKLRDAIGAADPSLMIAAFACATLGFVARAERWRGLLGSIKRVSFRTCFEILSIGYAVANFAPRGSDLVVRGVLMMRAERVSMAAMLATCAVERLLDLLVVVFLFAGYLVLDPPASLGDVSVATARGIGVVLVAASLILVAVLVLVRLREEACFAVLERLLRPLPPRLRERILRLLRSFSSGLELFREPRMALVASLWTVIGWITVGASMYLVCQSLGLKFVRPLDCCLLMGLGVVGIAVPAPGGMGSFHYFILQGLRGLGSTDLEVGKAAAILIWSTSFVPTTILGVAALLRRGLSWGELEAGAAATPAPSPGEEGR